MNGEGTFREWCESNKKNILKYLEGKGYTSTGDIQSGYNGEKDIYQVRKALKELKSEGKIIFKIYGVNSKIWKLKEEDGKELDKKRG